MIEPQQWLVGEPQFPHPQHARFQFEGVYQQRDVIWHCDLYTLQYFAEWFYPQQKPASLQQRLIIDSADNQHRISVALNLPVIDKSAVYKTIIMVRNYKRLHEGEHCYGPAYDLQQQGSAAER